MDINASGLKPIECWKLLSGTVVPRPIALVSTKNSEGILNVAPYSFFTVVTATPPTIMFSIGDLKDRKKDTLRNIEEHPEFVVNIAHVGLAESVNNASANFRSEISEFDEVQLTPIQAKVIDGVAVKEAPIHLECKLDRIIKVGGGNMVLGQVVHFYIDDDIYLGDYKTDFQKLKPLTRLAGTQYGEVTKVFTLDKRVNLDKVL